MKWGQKRSDKTGDELALTAVRAALEMRHHSQEPRLHPLVQKGVCPPEPLPLRCCDPEASLRGPAILLQEDAGKQQTLIVKQGKPFPPVSALLGSFAARLGGELHESSYQHGGQSLSISLNSSRQAGVGARTADDRDIHTAWGGALGRELSKSRSYERKNTLSIFLWLHSQKKKKFYSCGWQFTKFSDVKIWS